MKSIFSYTDFRAYLRDHYAERKAGNHSYSFRYFARKAGLESPNYLKLVMDGKRNLTHRNVRKFAKGLALDSREAIYFENLVFYTQAKDQPERDFYAANLKMARTHEEREFLSMDQYQAIAKWYPMAIKELVLLSSFQPKPKWIASRFDYRITPEEAREGLELLERLNLIKIDRASGKVEITKQSLQTPDEVQSKAASQYHLAMLDQAKEALKNQPSTDRCFSALTVALRKADLPEVFKKIHEFRNQIDTYLVKRKPFDSVYQLNINLFRLDHDV